MSKKQLNLISDEIFFFFFWVEVDIYVINPKPYVGLP